MTRNHGDSGSWWGDLRLSQGAAARWRIGPLDLAVRRGRDEWQLAWGWDPDLANSQKWEVETEAELPAEPDHQERYVVGESGDRLAVRPVLADRPVVSLPRLPVRLLPEREATLYVGSPVWVRIEVGEPPDVLRELPSRRLSDTWFGGSTRDGELCYATHTRARLRTESLPIFSRSAVTPVLIRNHAATPLEIERLKLPVPLLSLYCGPEGRLWTERVTLTRGEESQMATLDIGDSAPEDVAGADLVTPPRATTQPNLFIRAFSGLFGIGGRKEE